MYPASEQSPEPDEPWDVHIFRLIDPGIDETLIVENLRRTPTERLQRMQSMLQFIERARDDRHLAPR